jgi:hypothetical protein
MSTNSAAPGVVAPKAAATKASKFKPKIKDSESEESDGLPAQNIVLKARQATAQQRKRKSPPKRASSSGAAPLSNFMLFAAEQRPLLAVQYPTLSFLDIGRKIGKLWQNMSPEKRSRYTEVAAQNRMRVVASADSASSSKGQLSKVSSEARSISAGGAKKLKKAASDDDEDSEVVDLTDAAPARTLPARARTQVNYAGMDETLDDEEEEESDDDSEEESDDDSEEESEEESAYED